MPLLGVVPAASFKLLQKADHVGSTESLLERLKPLAPDFFKSSLHRFVPQATSRNHPINNAVKPAC
jgi:hypothetical protein